MLRAYASTVGVLFIYTIHFWVFIGGFSEKNKLIIWDFSITCEPSSVLFCFGLSIVCRWVLYIMDLILSHLPGVYNVQEVGSLGKWNTPLKQWELQSNQPVLSKNKNTGERLSCKIFWNAAAAKLLQSCPTLSNPIDCSPPGSSVHGIFQARVLEWWVAIAFSIWNATWA